LLLSSLLSTHAPLDLISFALAGSPANGVTLSERRAASESQMSKLKAMKYTVCVTKQKNIHSETSACKQLRAPGIIFSLSTAVYDVSY
jgi:hypothetical protein